MGFLSVQDSVLEFFHCRIEDGNGASSQLLLVAACGRCCEVCACLRSTSKLHSQAREPGQEVSRKFQCMTTPELTTQLPALLGRSHKDTNHLFMRPHGCNTVLTRWNNRLLHLSLSLFVSLSGLKFPPLRMLGVSGPRTWVHEGPETPYM